MSGRRVPAANARVVLSTPLAIGIVILIAGTVIAPMVLIDCLFARALAAVCKLRSLTL